MSRTSALPRPYRLARTLATVLITVLASAFPPTAKAQNNLQPQGTAEARPLARWLDAQAFTLAARYNHIENAQDRTLQNRVQTNVQARARLKLDEAGRYSVNAGVFTGKTFTGGWNSTGIGTGDGTAAMYLKQLFVAAQPWDGIELHYGSVAPVRGQSTEITSYDNDGYLTAARATVRRPAEIFFDEITVSVGYLGYLTTPFIFDRTGAFSRQNYWQLLGSKQILAGLTLSTDYSVHEDDGVLRQGATWRVNRPLIDAVAGEYGVRLRGGSHQAAFAFRGEKQVGPAIVQVGYANVDPVFGVLNGDPYGRGNRVFTMGSFPLPLDLSASWFLQKEISPPATSANNLRLDLAVTWNVLRALRRAGALPGPSPSGRAPRSR